VPVVEGGERGTVAGDRSLGELGLARAGERRATWGLIVAVVGMGSTIARPRAADQGNGERANCSAWATFI